DRRNHHLFQPLLYQVATAALNPSDIATPIRRVLRRQQNAEVILGEATSVDVRGKRVLLRDGVVPYDFLVIATGATHAYFGHPEWEKDAPGLKTLEDAIGIRRRVLIAYEAAEREDDPGRRQEWLTFVVVGGGPTGGELAGGPAGPRALGDLGGGGGALADRALAWRPSGSRRPGEGRARPVHPGRTGGLRHRRPRRGGGHAGQTGARAGAARHPGRPPCRAPDPAHAARAVARPVPLPRKGPAA